MSNKIQLNKQLEEQRSRERARLLAKASAVKEQYYADESFYNDEFADELFEEEEFQVPVDQSNLVEKKGTGISVVMNSSVPTYFVKGKQMTPEGAYGTAHLEALVAACYTFYHDNTAGLQGGSVEVFTAVAMQLLATTGTAIPKIDTAGVVASVKHIKTAEIDPYKAMRETSEAVKKNAPRAAIADANNVGAASHIVFQDSGEIQVPTYPPLNNLTTKALGNLGVVHIPPLTKTVDTVIQTLGNFNVHTKNLATQLMEMEPDEAPEIKEPNVFRPYAKTAGTMTNGILPRGNDGYYVQVLRYLRLVENEEIDVLFIPGGTTISNSAYDPADELSAIISLPKEVDMSMASPSLMATVIPWSDVKTQIYTTEKLCKEDPSYKGKNARATAHAQFADNYDHYRLNGHGETPQKQSYVVLYNAEPISADKLLEAHDSGHLAFRPALVRAGDFHNARKNGLNTGSFVWIDLPSMIGLYLSDAYIAQYVRDGAKTKDGHLKHMKGYLVMRLLAPNAAAMYMTWLCRYMFSFLVSVRIYDEGMRKRLMRHYLDLYAVGKKFPAALFDEMEWVYGGEIPALKAVVVRYAAYSMIKVAKYSTLMSDDIDTESHFGDLTRTGRKLRGEKPPPDESQGTKDATPTPTVSVEGDIDDDVDLDRLSASSMYGDSRT